jgi:hypothetical protein
MAERVGKLVKQRTPADTELAVYLAIPADDKESLKAAGKIAGHVALVTRPASTTAVKGWNLAAAAALRDGADWLVLGADDIVWHTGWLKAALKTADETKAQVIGLNDGHTNLDHYGAHYMVSASFVKERLGGVFIPIGYKSWWFDREVCERAAALGLYAPCPDAVAEHLHPDWKTAEMDDTYRLGYAHHKADQRIYENRKESGWPTK